MKFLLVFIFNVLLISTLASALTNDTKIHKILKNVGKRYNHYRMMRRDPVIKLNVNLLKFQDKSDEEIEQLQKDQSMLIGEFLVQQQALTDRSSELADKLGEMLHPKLVATVCGTDRKLNYYQFRDYLFQQRKQYVQSAYNITPVYNFYKTGRAKLHFSMRFTQKGVLGTVSNIEYEVEAILFPVHEDTGLDYAVSNVTIGGSCAMKGAVRGPDETFQDRMKKRPEVIQLFSQVIRSDVAHLIESESWLPMKWTDSLETSNSEFKAMMCSPETEKPTEITDPDTFHLWWYKFSWMWRPHLLDKEFISGQVVRYVPNEEMVTRFTMKLQLGRHNTTVNERNMTYAEMKRTFAVSVHDWELMIRSEYNKKGEGLWYITKVDFGCPTTLNIPKSYYEALPKLLAITMIELGRSNYTDWQNRLMAFKPFLVEKPQLKYCTTPPVDSIEHFAVNLWRWKVGDNATLDSFYAKDRVTKQFIHDPATNHANEFNVWILWRAAESLQTDPNDPLMHYSEMKIKGAFNPSLNFYEIKSFFLHCLKTKQRSKIVCGTISDTCSFFRLG